MKIVKLPIWLVVASCMYGYRFKDWIYWEDLSERTRELILRYPYAGMN